MHFRRLQARLASDPEGAIPQLSNYDICVLLLRRTTAGSVDRVPNLDVQKLCQLMGA